MSQPDSKSCPFWTIPKCSGRTRKRAAENLEGMCPHQSCLGIPLTPQAAEVEEVRRPGWGSLHVSALGIPQPPLLPHQPGLASREENSLTSLRQRLSSPFVCDPRRNLILPSFDHVDSSSYSFTYLLSPDLVSESFSKHHSRQLALR